MENIRKILENGNIKNSVYSKATVLAIKKSIIHISHTKNINMYAQVCNESGVLIGYIYSVSTGYAIVYLIVDASKVEIMDTVLVSDKQIQVGFHDNVLGTIINPIGDLIYTFTAKDHIENNRYVNIFQNSPSYASRAPLDDQLITGYNIIDFIYPIGYGQRMLVIGDKQMQKTTVGIKSIKTILNNRACISRDKKTIAIYVSVGQRKVDIARILDTLIENTINNTLIISADSSDPVGLQYLAPYSAFAIANLYALNGYNIYLIVDDLTKHANACRELSLASGNTPGREAYSSDIFYQHSSLLERALKYKGAGSITCLGVVETYNENIDSYITTNLISITDGQLFHETAMHKNLIYPPISNTLSVSRTGSSVQINIFKTVTAQCKKALAIYNSKIDFYMMYKDDCDDQMKASIRYGMYIINMLYKICDKPLDAISQMISVVMIKHDIKYNESTIEKMESNEFADSIKKFISSVRKDIEDDKELMLLLNNDINNSLIAELIHQKILMKI